MNAQAEIAPSQAEELVAFFAEGWRIGASDPERFYAHFGSRLTPDALMTQPLAAPARGPAGLRELFAPLFAAMPDFGVEVLRWGATSDGAMIEIRLRGTLSGRTVTWTAVDRLVLRDGLIAERHSYFDPLPVALKLVRSPRLMWATLRRGR